MGRRVRRRGREDWGLSYVYVNVTRRFLEKIRDVAWTEGYTDVSDYIRDLMRKDLKERGITIEMEKKPAEEA